MGGGGANSLDSPKIADNSDFDDAQNEDDVADAISYEKREFSSYLSDYAVPSFLEEKGTQNDPWQIDCLEDFLYLFTTALQNKYIELNCNIVLNDEDFDENGTPRGGDGIYYNWQGRDFNGSVFEGNGYTISGLFNEDLEKANNVGLFLSVYQSTIQNLKLTNVYINSYIDTSSAYSGYVGGLCRSFTSSTATNLFLEGSVNGGGVGGLIGVTGGVFEIENCVTKVKLCGSFIGGLVSIVFGNSKNTSVIKNCETYGDIDTNRFAGGIAVDIGPALILIENTHNHININSTGGNVAGFVVRANSYPATLTIRNCKNYGNVSTDNYYPGGFLSMCSANVFLEGCENYGKISGKGRSNLIGYILNEGSGRTIEIKIQNCYVRVEGNKQVDFSPIFVYSARKNELNEVSLQVKDVKADLDYDGNVALFSSTLHVDDIEIEKVEVNLVGNISNIRLFAGNFNYGERQIKNIIVNVEQKGTLPTRSNFVDDYGRDFNPNGVLFNIKGTNGTRREYYGSDFSDFYLDWRTGKIGLKSLNGKGFYQGNVTEEILISKGFEKKAL